MTDLEACGADTLVIERVERFFSNMAENAAVMEAPVRTISPDDLIDMGTCAVSKGSGLAGYLLVEGTLGFEEEETPESTAADAAEGNQMICVSLDGEIWYEAFPVTIEEEERNPYGFRAWVPIEGGEQAETVRVALADFS